MFKNNNKEKVEKLVNQLVELEEKISDIEQILRTCSELTRDNHSAEKKELEKRYYRKFELVKILRG